MKNSLITRWLLPAVLGLPLAATAIASAASQSMPKGAFHLEAESTQRVSLIANDAPLSEILSRLGEALDIEIVAKLPDDPRVTAEFTARPLADALRQLAGSYMLLTDEVDGRIAKVFVLPEGADAAEFPAADVGPSEPVEVENAPFEFEFDPAAVPEETDPGETDPP
jgi:type II secretory pathway component GspD/PulD (secretin)